MTPSPLRAGAAVVDITPRRPMFLHGYPHVPRTSTGTLDPLLATALCVEAGGGACFFVSADVLFITKQIAARARLRIAERTGVPPERILISTTHTHSGPVMVNYEISHADPVVPQADPDYLRQFEDGLVQAATDAWQRRRPAELAYVEADATGIGTCRHDPAGPSLLNVPVLSAREVDGGRMIGVLMVCAMHPTVLHEDSKLFSGDFPAYARQYLQRHVVGSDCPVIYHTGAAGNQSPRHVTRGNTPAEAERLGAILGRAVEQALSKAKYVSDIHLASAQRLLDLPVRTLPPVEQAERQLAEARQRFDRLRAEHAPRTTVRTAECDWFGAEETLCLSRAAAEGRVEESLRASLPAEVQVLAIGPWRFVGWPGEFFVEFALRVREAFPGTAIITLANGELQGYIVTQEAVDRRWYEASNALLQSPAAGDRVVEATLDLLRELGEAAHVS